MRFTTGFALLVIRSATVPSFGISQGWLVR
jgi:hypothetical protein